MKRGWLIQADRGKYPTVTQHALPVNRYIGCVFWEAPFYPLANLWRKKPSLSSALEVRLRDRFRFGPEVPVKHAGGGWRHSRPFLSLWSRPLRFRRKWSLWLVSFPSLGILLWGGGQKEASKLWITDSIMSGRDGKGHIGRGTAGAWFFWWWWPG